MPGKEGSASWVGPSSGRGCGGGVGGGVPVVGGSQWRVGVVVVVGGGGLHDDTNMTPSADSTYSRTRPKNQTPAGDKQTCQTYFSHLESIPFERPSFWEGAEQVVCFSILPAF